MASTSRGAPEPLLALRDLHVYREQVHVLQGVSLTLGAEPLAVVGRNGMGKTTLCEAVMGLLGVAAGRIGFAGFDVTGLRPHEIARRGIGYVPQGRRVFHSLTTREHLEIIRCRSGSAWTVERIYDTFPRLAARRHNRGSELSGGEQQMLAIARALMPSPRLLIMDEPTEGLAPRVVDQLMDVLRAVIAGGVGLLLVEQNLAVAAALASRMLVMVNGRVALETSSAHLMSSEELQRRYLGIGFVDIEAATGEQTGRVMRELR
jgi:branched-chain amino acid transport system ATP-binding protein